MFCEQCGKKIDDDSKFCENCGVSIEEEQVPQTMVHYLDNKKTSTSKENGALYNKHSDETEQKQRANSSSPVGSTPVNTECNIIVCGDDVAQQGDWIYLCGDWKNNSFFEGLGLYKIRTDGSNKTKLNNDCSSNIAVAGEWIYYVNYNEDYKRELCKIRTNGGNKIILYKSDDPYSCINVVGDWIYFVNEDDNKIYKIKTDGSGRKKISNDKEVDYIKVIGDIIYYHCNYDIRKIDTNGHGKLALGHEIIEGMFIVGNWIFYVDRNKECLCKVQTNGSNQKTLTNSGMALAIAAVVGDWVYFIKSSEDLYKIRTDGTNQMKFPCRAVSVNIIGDWIYFREDAFYKIRTDGTQKQFIHA